MIPSQDYILVITKRLIVLSTILFSQIHCVEFAEHYNIGIAEMLCDNSIIPTAVTPNVTYTPRL